jgi:hypothetical protein
MFFSIQLLPHKIELIPDKFDAHGRKFTDGIGKISPMALREVSHYIFAHLNLNWYLLLILGTTETQSRID